jgi:hypothetical protein
VTARPARRTPASRARGLFLCPVTGYVVRLGTPFAVRLDGPCRLAWQPSSTGIWNVTRPDPAGAQALARVGDRVLGPGCVIAAGLVHIGAPEHGGGGLYLDPAPDADPAGWLINEPLQRTVPGAAADGQDAETVAPANEGTAVRLIWQGHASYGARFELGKVTVSDKGPVAMIKRRGRQWEAFVMGKQVPGGWDTPEQAREAAEMAFGAKRAGEAR